MALIIAVATDAIEPVQVNIVMSVVSTLCLAIPLSLLCLGGCAVMILVAYSGSWGYKHVRTPIRAVRRLTDTITAQTKQQAPKIARPTMALNTHITRVEHSLRHWIAPVETSGRKDSYDESSE
ncbi:MAG: hypothetical protein JXA10_19205 [Anaerolineae bacterium]|nr:hypothetical protein [Anaerolineae bacterium]